MPWAASSTRAPPGAPTWPWCFGHQPHDALARTAPLAAAIALLLLLPPPPPPLPLPLPLPLLLQLLALPPACGCPPWIGGDALLPQWGALLLLLLQL